MIAPTDWLVPIGLEPETGEWSPEPKEKCGTDGCQLCNDQKRKAGNDK